MGLKFDSVMSREFSGMRPQALIRRGNCKFPVSTTAPRRSDFQKRSQFFVRAHNEALTIATMGVRNEDCSSRWNPRLRRSPTSNRLC